MKKSLPYLTVASLGLVIGLGTFTGSHAKGLSYLKDDPAACVNCHVMQEQYDSWSRSSHREWATCNECHMPHETIPKYYRKALNGWNHSVKFTSGDFPDPIMIAERNKEVALENCLTCHQNMVNDMLLRGDKHRDGLRCTECHGNVGHLGVG